MIRTGDFMPDQPLVPVEEVRAASGLSIADFDALAEEAGIQAHPDWQGTLGLTLSDAQRIASGALRRDAEHKRREAEWKAEALAWERARDDAARAAGERARQEVLDAGGKAGAASAARFHALMAAGEDFERAHKRPNEYARLIYVLPAENGKLLPAIAAKAKRVFTRPDDVMDSVPVVGPQQDKHGVFIGRNTNISGWRVFSARN